MINKKNYYILSYTWGILISIIGLIIAAALFIMGKRPVKNLYGWTFVVGKNWGGLSLGPISLICERGNKHTYLHEFGHSIQNCYFGPFMIFICIASAGRYWYRRIFNITNPPYDSIWFEGQATKLGELYETSIK